MSHLHVPRIYRPTPPSGSSTAAHFHYAAQRPARVALDEKQALDPIPYKINLEMIIGISIEGVPLTRLLLDSNFVSITDIVNVVVNDVEEYAPECFFRYRVSTL